MRSIPRSRGAVLAGVVCLVALVLVASLGGFSRTPALERVRAPTSARLGLIANALDNGTRRHLVVEDARTLGVGWLREEFRWADVEPRPGARRWGKTDRLMVSTARRGIRVLPLLYASPRWAAATRKALPARPATFAAFTRRAVERYGPGGSFWRAHPELDGRLAPRDFEVWNEPDLRDGQARIEPASYARVYRAAVAAGRKANPGTRYLVASALTYYGPDGRLRDWMGALFAAEPDIGEDIDGLAIHPYTYDRPGATGGRTEDRFTRIGAIADRVEQLDGGRPPLWITEIGWSTCKGRPAECVSEAEQARRIGSAFDVLRRRYGSRVAGIFLYNDQDGVPQRGNRERTYGLRRNDASRKPAWFTVRRVLRRR